MILINNFITVSRLNTSVLRYIKRLSRTLGSHRKKRTPIAKTVIIANEILLCRLFLTFDLHLTEIKTNR